MANKIIVLAIFCGVQVLTVCCADLEKCLCNDNSTGATWGHMLNSTKCRGKCDVAEKTESWTCILDHNTTSICKRVVPCVINDTCEGTWGVWGSIGSCNATCGKGFRPQERTCYKNITTGNITIQYLRNKYCLGGKGSKTQQQLEECEKGSCTTTIKSITSVKFRTTASQQNAEITRTTKSSVIIEIVDKSSVSTLPQESFTDEADQFQNLSSQVDVLTLAAVLGSVALICLAIVVIAFIVVRRRRAANPRKPSEESNDYEVVAPALPPLRPTNQNASSDNLFHVSSPNVLYNPNAEHSSRRKLSSDIEVYLAPLPSPTSTLSLAGPEGIHVEEATYVSIQDCRR